MLARLLGSTLLIAFLPVCLLAQEAIPMPDPFGAAGGQDVGAANPADDAAAVTGQQMLDQIQTLIQGEIQSLKDDLTSRVKKNEEAISELVTSVNELRNEIQQQAAAQQANLSNSASNASQASSTGGGTAAGNPDVNPIQQPSPSDQTGAQCPTEGTLHITNKTGTYRTVFVNQRQYGVSAGATTVLKVPVGNVTTNLTGQSIQSWTIGEPNYEQKLDIVLNGTSTSDSSTTTVTTNYPSTTTSTASTVTYMMPTDSTVTYYVPSTSATTTYYVPSTTGTTTYYLAPTTAGTTTYYLAPGTTLSGSTVYYRRPTPILDLIDPLRLIHY